jgi:hypothetical protein
MFDRIIIINQCFFANVTRHKICAFDIIRESVDIALLNSVSLTCDLVTKLSISRMLLRSVSINEMVKMMEINTKKERSGYLAYCEHIRTAKLDGGAKGLLWFYGFTYNWKGKKPSRYAERTICSLVGMSLGTYHSRRKYLEDFEWIKVHPQGKNQQALVVPLVGRDDPDYENRCWADWHPSNRTYEPEVIWDEASGQFINVIDGEIVNKRHEEDSPESLEEPLDSLGDEW